MSAEKENSYRHILRYTSLFGGVQGLNIAISLVRNKLVAVLLGPDGMGLVSLFNSTVKLVSDSTNLGLAISAVKRISQSYDNGDEDSLHDDIALVRSWSCVTAIVGFVVMALAGNLLSHITFNWGDHSLHFTLLAFLVGMMAVTGGEMAIMKSTRMLRQIAKMSLYNVLMALILSVPMFWLWGQAAIVPSMLLLGLQQMLLTLYYTCRQYPYRVSMDRASLGRGGDMLKLGIAFVFAGIMGSGADFVVKSFLNNVASLENVGLYNAAYMIAMTYSGMVFTSMETDYFPRLSSVGRHRQKRDIVINRQIEVSLLLISPMLVGLTISLPLLLPMLFSTRFGDAIPMTQVLVLALYIRAVKIPMQYLPLSQGDSLSYLLLEGIYAVMIMVFVPIGFNYGNLMGAGIALTAVGLLDGVITFFYLLMHYHYVPSALVFVHLTWTLTFGVAAYACTLTLSGTAYWVTGAVLTVLNAAISMLLMKKRI